MVVALEGATREGWWSIDSPDPIALASCKRLTSDLSCTASAPKAYYSSSRWALFFIFFISLFFVPFGYGMWLKTETVVTLTRGPRLVVGGAGAILIFSYSISRRPEPRYDFSSSFFCFLSSSGSLGGKPDRIPLERHQKAIGMHPRSGALTLTLTLTLTLSACTHAAVHLAEPSCYKPVLC